MKRSETIQHNVKVDDGTTDRIRKLAGQMGVEYMNQSNRDINDVLRDGETVCRLWCLPSNVAIPWEA